MSKPPSRYVLDFVCAFALSRSWFEVERFDAHFLHQRTHMTSADFKAFCPQLVSDPAAVKRVLEVDLVDCFHEPRSFSQPTRRLIVYA